MKSHEHTSDESLLLTPAFWLIVLAAGAIRLYACWSSLPYFSFAEEGLLLNPVARMLSAGSVDPGWYHYPAFLMYCIALVAKICGLFANSSLPYELLSPSLASYDIIYPSFIILCGRMIVAICGLGIVILTGLIAEMCCSRNVGLGATAFASLLPALVIRSTYVTAATPATFLILLSMYLASKTLDDNGRYRLVLSSALVAGFALGTHYPAGLVFLCPLISFSMVEFRIPSRWPVGLGLVGCLIVGALFGLPAIFWNLNGVLAALSSTHYGFITRPESLSYLDQLVLPQEAGWPFALVGVAGLLRILRSPHPRDHFRPWILFLTIFTALYFFFDYQPLDNLLPILPLLCLAAATVFLGTEPPEKKPSIVSWLLIGGLCVVLALHCAPLVLNLANQQDSRSEAVQYLAATATAKDVIVVEKELAIHPAELAQLSSKIIELPATILLARLDGSKSSIVIGSSKLSSDLRLRGYCVKASFGYTPKLDSPKKWRSSKQQVDIWAPCKK